MWGRPRVTSEGFYSKQAFFQYGLLTSATECFLASFPSKRFLSLAMSRVGAIQVIGKDAAAEKLFQTKIDEITVRNNVGLTFPETATCFVLLADGWTAVLAVGGFAASVLAGEVLTEAAALVSAALVSAVLLSAVLLSAGFRAAAADFVDPFFEGALSSSFLSCI